MPSQNLIVHPATFEESVCAEDDDMNKRYTTTLGDDGHSKIVVVSPAKRVSYEQMEESRDDKLMVSKSPNNMQSNKRTSVKEYLEGQLSEL